MAIKLKQAGYKHFTVFEKAASIGGTWRDNTYPGLACDVPSHLYSYSFDPNPAWSHVYSPGWEIQQYTERCVDKNGIRPYIRVDSEVMCCEFGDGVWHIETADGANHKANILISAMGGLHLPKLPDIAGRENFDGVAFHSANWTDTDLKGKRVAVIGSAASAVQIVPAIAEEVDQLYLYQRTPNWIIPRRDRAFSALTKWCFQSVPGAARTYRWFLYWIAEARWPSFRRNSIANRLGRLLGKAHLRRQVPDEALRARLTPNYPIGCKRILRSDDFYPALLRDNVELVTNGIDRIEADAVITRDGLRHVVDVIVYATGFDVFDITGGTQIIGLNGQSLAGYWHDGIAAHRTIAVPGFPNFFILQGPNSALGHSSVIFMLEAQVRYVIGCLEEMQERGWKTIVPQIDAFESYQSRLTADLQKMIWAVDCNSWYKDNKGRVFTLWPRTCTNYWYTMRHPKIDEYQHSD